MTHTWRYHKKIESAVLERMQKTYGLPASVANILCHRGIIEPDELERFLTPSLSHLPSPFLMKGMTEAVQLLIDTVDKKREIVLYGDYDADGVTALSVLYLFLASIGVKTKVAIPDRHKHGYGLNQDLLRELATGLDQQNCLHGSLLVTVDCGISDFEEVSLAKQLGFHVIVTDHHQPPERLPEADAIVNPHQHDCPFPDKRLAGVGVAFYLLMGFRQILRDKGFWKHNQAVEPNLKNLLDLVAIGTICDMVPLLGVNRVLVKAGLEVLAAGGRPGVAALMKHSGMAEGNALGAEDIGFKIGPRLNAAGRMQHALQAFQLLVTEDTEEVDFLAASLEDLNDSRRTETERIVELACEQAKEQLEHGAEALVVGGLGWHHGVLGIVASRLVDLYYLPTIVLGWHEDDVFARGSGRSVKPIDLHQIISRCSCFVDRFGGHAQAAGLSLRKELIAAFGHAFASEVRSARNGRILLPELIIDAKLDLIGDGEALTEDFFLHYRRLAPFGMGNPEPVFVSSLECIRDPQVVGVDHLRFSWQCNDLRHKGIGFGFGHHATNLRNGQRGQMAFAFRVNVFRERQNWQIHLLGVKPEEEV